MIADDTLTLRYTPEQVEHFCRHLATHAPGSEQHLAALTALQTFIAAGVDAGEQARSPYLAIRQVLERHLEQARTLLLQHNTQRLLHALQQRDVSAVAALYRPLSRSGFWEALTYATAELEGPALAALAVWATAWVTDARQRGEQASGCPDAIDFHQAGIDVTEYSAMNDIQRFFGERQS
ncbi:hypothetical protein [Sulfurivermis fontis]|jgi:hypothetical protein|uniref:hypothetical protein n=1 Tax=Sulfurivermis fontis TaxID=1972068 RepID=UPI000FD98754|nr:hypothetical protein [Sulfurivermis fontis]